MKTLEKHNHPTPLMAKLGRHGVVVLIVIGFFAILGNAKGNKLIFFFVHFVYFFFFVGVFFSL
jgi:hypothetical protein